MFYLADKKHVNTELFLTVMSRTSSANVSFLATEKTRQKHRFGSINVSCPNISCQNAATQPFNGQRFIPARLLDGLAALAP